MEIIIGREEGARRLHINADGREFNIGSAGSVPLSVSRNHCKLTITQDKIRIENLKAKNKTYVDGMQVFSKSISPTCDVQLGDDKFSIPIRQIMEMATGKSAQPRKCENNTFSLAPLEAVWNEYNSKKQAVHDAQNKKAKKNKLMNGGRMAAVGVGMLVAAPVAAVAGIAMGAHALLEGSNEDESVQRQLARIDEEYSTKYACPNPECAIPLGPNPFLRVKRMKRCPNCGCKYTL